MSTLRSARRRARWALLAAYRPWALRSIEHGGRVRHRGLHLDVPPDVFHPGLLSSSTRFVVRALDQLDVAGRSVLELGCGAGLISLVLAKRGALVTAVDVNEAAVRTTAANAASNGLVVRALRSDLLAGVAGEHFDAIVVTPPYFRRDPRTDAERAWFAGAGFEYYAALFAQVREHVAAGTFVLIGQSEDCDVDAVQAHAAASGLHLVPWYRRLVWLDEQSLYQVVLDTTTVGR